MGYERVVNNGLEIQFLNTNSTGSDIVSLQCRADGLRALLEVLGDMSSKLVAYEMKTCI